MKIVFFGSPELAVPFLAALKADPAFEVVAAVTQPDKPSGRGKTMSAAPVKETATRLGIPVLPFVSLRKDPAAAEALRALGADLFVVVAYGKLIPKGILELPRLGCVNVHPSLLPKHRGPSPMQYALAQGDPTTGISIMSLDEGMDTGPILAFESIGVDDVETLPSLSAKVMRLGPPLLVSTLKRLAKGEIVPMPQHDAKATVTKLLEREDGHLDWAKPVAEVERLVRAYLGWPGTFAVWTRNGSPLRLKVLSARPTDLRADFPPGTVRVADGRLLVEAADGTLEILALQPEGKAAMTAAQFLSGYSDINGAVLA
ncbi:methionyl-tRNA formyltransferase [Patescibacteria group bacterium]|nr:MAG: methionyl-tRNA formyltransferase [Patescibacteria group bacterium]